MRQYGREETIAAIATPPGEGGVAIIRISGKEAVSIAAQIFSGPVQEFQSHTVHFGDILSSNKQVIDEGLLIVMKSPRSYTGEDVVELHCHGGVMISRRVLEAAFASGASPALPGEFTFRAFQNGKIDLAKAEAEIAAVLEAWVDFPEEGLEFMTKEEMKEKLSLVKEEMVFLLSTFADGKVIKTLPSLSLIGSPNVGKSSLLNLLAGKERAIVTSMPGTTRDLIEEEIQIGALIFRLTDTAGLRETESIVEKEGIKRAQRSAEEADLVLLVLDVTHSSPPENSFLATLQKEKTVVVWNKIDLPHSPLLLPSFPHQVKVSAKMETGLEELKKVILCALGQKGDLSKEEVLLTNQRHYEALRNSIQGIENILSGLSTEVSPEFLACDIRFALKELGTIIGADVTEDILDTIFSTFCVGK
ncbi:MAG: tRNA modification GTPase [Simkania negevensis]|nr:tRNA modification GTPase [Simkania negevensis]